MIETHPFGDFVPPEAKYLILGSFTGRQAVKGTAITDDSYDWFYGTRRNQFWPILESVYGVELRDVQSKQALLAKLRIAMADIIYQCERSQGNNLDSNLAHIVYNRQGIARVFEEHHIKEVFFTSRFVKSRFCHVFRDVLARHPAMELVTLPSPSPRYALMPKEEKIARYKQLLPER